METGMPEGTSTLVVLADDTTSLYLSNGGGVIGAGTNQEVRNPAHRFFKALSDAAAQLSSAQAHPVPGSERVRFYLITAGGLRTAEAAQDDLGYNRHQLSPVFHAAHEVVSAVIWGR
jgi:hypothetical protein